MNPLSDYLHAQKFTEAAAEREGGVWYSEPEIRIGEALTARGFPFVQQHRVALGKSSAVLDFLIASALALEIDGRDYHDPVKDAARDREVIFKYGYWTLRVSGWRAMKEPEDIVGLIALKLSELGISVRRPTRVLVSPSE